MATESTRLTQGTTLRYGDDGRPRIDLKPVKAERVAVNLLGFDLTRFPGGGGLAALSGLTFVASVSFMHLQDRTFHIPGFVHTGWMTNLTLATWVVMAALEMRLTGDRRRGAWRDYLVLAVFAGGGTYLTNSSVQYLSYPLRVMFKSAQVLPVMAISAAYVGKRYGWRQWLAVACLVLGIILFLLGDAQGAAGHAGAPIDPRGVALITAGMLTDAAASNFQEKRLFCGSVAASSTEVLFFTSAPALVVFTALDVATGKFLPALAHTRDHPEVVVFCVASAVLGYLGTNLLLLLVKHHGATVAALAKGVPKLATVLLSFLAFGRAFRSFHVLGTSLFALSVVLEFAHRSVLARKRVPPPGDCV